MPESQVCKIFGVCALCCLLCGIAPSKAQAEPDISALSRNGECVVTCTAAQRGVVLQSTRNTRDLGGLPIDGGHIKSGILFRSGALCYATVADQRRLSDLRLRRVIDLRTPKEIAKEGADRWLEGKEVKTLFLPMFSKRGNGALAYRSYMLDNDAAWKDLFSALAERESYPLLYHCSGGKDRTGVVTAVLLELLGTPRSVIMDDYLQSQRNAPRLEVHREWLQEVFSLLDEAGGVRNFFGQRGVAEDTLLRVVGNLR